MSDWDVDSYKTDFESEEHWELRRNFMLAHKEKLPEDEVVCLAQVFTNIELLGCRYPEETMQRVAELAKGVVEEYREKRKSCLKRTFVAASDAAVAKAKGSSTKWQRKTPVVKSSCNKISENNKDMVNIFKDMEFADFNGCIWDNFKISSHTNCHTEEKKEKGNKVCRNKWAREIDYRLSTSNFCCTLDPINIRKLNKPRFAFFLYDEAPVILLEKNASINKGTLRWEFKGPRSRKTCSVYYNDIFLGAGGKGSRRRAKEKAARKATKNLQSLCYTVKVKKHVRCLSKIIPSAIISQYNGIKLLPGIGAQLLKMMGWKGGGLGIRQQGITEPIVLQAYYGREGFGLGRNVKRDNAFKDRLYSLVRKWIKTDSEDDLVFTSDFTNSQKELLHTVASNLHVWSKSYGKTPDRYVVIYKKPNPRAIVRKLLKNGGKTNRYELIIPTVTRR